MMKCLGDRSPSYAPGGKGNREDKDSQEKLFAEMLVLNIIKEQMVVAK